MLAISHRSLFKTFKNLEYFSKSIFRPGLVSVFYLVGCFEPQTVSSKPHTNYVEGYILVKSVVVWYRTHSI